MSTVAIQVPVTLTVQLPEEMEIHDEEWAFDYFIETNGAHETEHWLIENVEPEYVKKMRSELKLLQAEVNLLRAEQAA